MSHSKWAKTELKKAVSDSKKSKIFGKIVKLIILEAKKANGNLEALSLKAVIEKAREVDMPKDNIDRAIKKATEEKNALETITYEAYGPGGVGIIIEALTDNRNKAAQEIKHILTKNGASLGAIGSVTWNFRKENGEWIPETTTEISTEDGAILTTIIEALEDNDEVQAVFTSAI
jgi:YebC/PmpR family DNA-binding regulatory protein